MTAKQLIIRLLECPPDSEVYIFGLHINDHVHAVFSDGHKSIFLSRQGDHLKEEIETKKLAEVKWDR
jgi:hypothetical protein